MVEDTIAKLYTANELHKEVIKCEYCGKEKKYGRLTLFGKTMDISVYDCDCLSRIAERTKYEDNKQHLADIYQYFKRNSDLPKEMKSFADWEHTEYTKSAETCFNTFTTFTDHYQVGAKGLIVYGGAGCGKSHLSIALADTLAKKGIKVVFRNVPKLFEDIYSTFDDSDMSTSAVLEPIINAQVVVLDDLGAEKPTDFVKTKLYYIINSLYNSGATIIVTTNVKKVSDLSDIIGFRAYDRLIEVCSLLYNGGQSYRRYVATKNLQRR